MNRRSRSSPRCSPPARKPTTTQPTTRRPRRRNVAERSRPTSPQRMAQLPRTVIDYDHSLLNDNERQVVAKLIEASKQIDEIYWRQVSEENPALRDAAGEAGRAADARLRLLHRQQGSVGPAEERRAVHRHEEEAGRRRLLSARHDEGRIREVRGRASGSEGRVAGTLHRRPPRRREPRRRIPYATYYNDFLEPAATQLREAAASTTTRR